MEWKETDRIYKLHTQKDQTNYKKKFIYIYYVERDKRKKEGQPPLPTPTAGLHGGRAISQNIYRGYIWFIVIYKYVGMYIYLTGKKAFQTLLPLTILKYLIACLG